MKNKSRAEWLAGALGALVSVAFIESMYAQAVRQDTGGARMDVSGYSFEGRYLLDAEDFTRTVAPLIGRQKPRPISNAHAARCSRRTTTLGTARSRSHWSNPGR